MEKKRKKTGLIAETFVITKKALKSSFEIMVSILVIFVIELCIGFIPCGCALKGAVVSYVINFSLCFIYIFFFVASWLFRRYFIKQNKLDNKKAVFSYLTDCLITTSWQIYFLMLTVVSIVEMLL